ncbi:Glycosyltransferase Gtf1 [bioreactor metagenome]|uniref:Glycosyltransferase Gtf1 n=1 Tax=bioreactor metagenome TaxID=1076179 RepID=A0A645E650_9ZZZZ
MGFNVRILSFVQVNKVSFQLDNDIPVHNLYPKKVSMKLHYLSAVRKIRNFVNVYEIDCLICVDSILCAFTIPALIGKKINHICWEHFNFNVDLGVFFRSFARKLAAKYCTTIVTLTNRDKELWQRGISNIHANIVPIPNPNPLKNINNRPHLSDKTILSIGRLTYQKGFDLLITAWAEVCKSNSAWKLKIIGNGEDETKLKQLAQDLEISDRVIFFPSTSEIDKYYCNSSFYCLSSRFEGFPMVLLEAQAFGLPIIAFNCDTGPSDLVVHKENGFLVENGSINDLAEKLLEALNLSEIDYGKLSSNTLEMRNKFSSENVILKWIEVL